MHCVAALGRSHHRRRPRQAQVVEQGWRTPFLAAAAAAAVAAYLVVSVGGGEEWPALP